MNSISFGQTIVDRPLLARMAKLEQNRNFRKPLVTNLVKNLNEVTEKTGDTAYLFAETNFEGAPKTGLPVEITVPSEQTEKITPITLSIVDNKGIVKFFQEGVIADTKGEIIFDDKNGKLKKYLAQGQNIDTFA